MKDKNRWLGKEKHFLNVNTFGKSPFGELNGYEDFRGISFPQGYKFIGKKANNVDFSYSNFSALWIENCEFKNCAFDYALLNNVCDHHNIFEDCQFFRTDFQKAGIGHKGSKYINCKFEQSNFIRAGFIRTEFTNCVFNNCKLKDTDFNASSFEKCSFVGNIEDVWFRGAYKFPNDNERFGIPRPNTMLNVSFEDAELHRIDFSQRCPLNTIKLPKTGQYIYCTNWKKHLLNLKNSTVSLSGDVAKELSTFTEVCLVHADEQTEYILNYDDILKDHGKEAADIIFEELNNDIV